MPVYRIQPYNAYQSCSKTPGLLERVSMDQMFAYLVLDNLSIDLEVLTKDGIGSVVSGVKLNHHVEIDYMVQLWGKKKTTLTSKKISFLLAGLTFAFFFPLSVSFLSESARISFCCFQSKNNYC